MEVLNVLNIVAIKLESLTNFPWYEVYTFLVGFRDTFTDEPLVCILNDLIALQQRANYLVNDFVQSLKASSETLIGRI